MSYSFTEKKRIRKSFAKRESVQEIPYLLAMQLESYAAFLQADIVPEKRAEAGLQATFASIFPIVRNRSVVTSVCTVSCVWFIVISEDMARAFF